MGSADVCGRYEREMDMMKSGEKDLNLVLNRKCKKSWAKTQSLHA